MIAAIAGAVGSLGTAAAFGGSLLVFSGNLLQSDPPPYCQAGHRCASAVIVAQIEHQLDSEIRAQTQLNKQEDRRHDETASALCSVYTSVEGRARAAVQRRPSDATAQTDLLVNSRLRQQWCREATGDK